MTNDFRSYNVIYIVYDGKNENHWSIWNTNSHIILLKLVKYILPHGKVKFSGVGKLDIKKKI